MTQNNIGKRLASRSYSRKLREYAQSENQIKAAKLAQEFAAFVSESIGDGMYEGDIDPAVFLKDAMDCFLELADDDGE